MTASHPPASARPAGIDTSSRLPRQLRPPTRDLPALAWLAARRFGQHPDGRPVGRYPAAAAFPLWLGLLLVQHQTGVLAARGRHAFVVVAPAWPAARRPYRRRMTTAAAAVTGGIVLPAALGLVVAYSIGADAEVSLAVLTAALVWLAGLVVHPLRRELAEERRRPPTTGPDAVAPGDRTVLVSSLCGAGRPAVVAGRLLRDVIEHADARGWALLTDGALSDRNAQQYARVGFAWLPDGSRRMLRPAAAGPTLLDASVEQAAAFADQLGVHLDEVRAIDGLTADSGRTGGRNFVRLPVSYLLHGALPGHARASLAHELGHHVLGHYTPARRRHRTGPKLVALAVAAPALAVAVLTAPTAVAGLAPAVTVAAWLAVVWLSDRPVRRGEHEADVIAVGLVGVEDVATQLRLLHAHEQAVNRSSRVLARLLDPAHPPLARRLKQVLQERPAEQQPVG